MLLLNSTFFSLVEIVSSPDVEDRGFFGRTGAMVKPVEAGLLSDVEEDDRCAIDEAAGGDGTRFCVFHWRRGAAGGRAGRFPGSGRLGACGFDEGGCCPNAAAEETKARTNREKKGAGPFE
jgi:hypothetical protein